MEDERILALPCDEKPSILKRKGNKLPLRRTQDGRIVPRRTRDCRSFRLNLGQFATGDNFTMKRLLAISLALLLISASPLIAGSRGFGGARGSFRPATPSKSIQLPKSKPIDSVKSRTNTGTPQTASGPAAPQAAPAPASGFFGSSWFGSSWMNWAIIGYLFGRHSSPTPEEARIKEREKAKKAEEAKQKEQAKEKEEVKSKEQDTTKEQTKQTDEDKSIQEPKDQTRPAAPTDSRQGM